MYFADYNSAFESFNWSEKSVLPLSGGWLDQPAILMEAVGIVAAEVSDHNKRESDFAK